MSGKWDKYGSPGSVILALSVAMNYGTFLELYLYSMSSSGISPGNIGVMFITIYDPPGQSFIKFSNVSKQKTLWVVFTSPQLLTPADIDSSAIFIELNQISAKYVSFDVSCSHPLVAVDSLLMHLAVPPISFWNYDVFIASFSFWISMCNIIPNLEHAIFFISVPNGSGFPKI